MQRLADGILGVAKESAKTVSREAFNATIRFVNGASATVLAFIPGRESIVEGLQGWELRPTFRAPRLPRWMEEGVSSFNHFVHECAANVEESGSESEYESDNDSAVSEESDAPSAAFSMFNRSPNSVAGHGRRRNHERSSWVFRWIRWFMWPLFFIVRDNSRPAQGSTRRMSRSSSSSSIASAGAPSLSSQGSLSSLKGQLSRRLNDLFEYATHVNDYRRRGILEDLQLIAELAIEKVFEFVRKLVHFFLSPWQSIAALMRRLTEPPVQRADKGSTAPETGSPSVVEEPSPRQQLLKMQQTLNMDCRTCEDIVTEAGYPYEALKVTTKDGYVLHLERIPRRCSRKVVYLQHGLLDSSLGWVSNGVIGSQAFAAYDQGYDVFLGNFRGYASQEHVRQNISSKDYWSYSVNEHGMMDIPAIVEKIHSIKIAELQGVVQSTAPALPTPSQRALPAASSSYEGTHLLPSSQQPSKEIAERASTSGALSDNLPYSLTGVTHSLGGAAILTYVVTRQLAKQPHRLSRLILLSPAGFHAECPFLFKFIGSLVPFIDPIMTRYLPGFFIPTRGLRLLFNKLAQDFQNLPGLRALVQVLISSVVVGGDASDWVGSLRTPHYNMYNMPGLSYRVAKHLSQMWKTGRFTLYDYGSPQANMAVYGSATPLDVGSKYNLINIPVDLVSGKRDRLIPPSMVLRHYCTMKEAGVEVTLKEFEYAHLDFTFAHKEDLLAYVMSRLTLPPVGFRGLADVEDVFRRQRHPDLQRSIDRPRTKGITGSSTAASVRRRGKSPLVDSNLLEGLRSDSLTDDSARGSDLQVSRERSPLIGRSASVNLPVILKSGTSSELSGYTKGGHLSSRTDVGHSTTRLAAWLQQLVTISPVSAPSTPRVTKGRVSPLVRKRQYNVPPVLSGVAEVDEEEDEIKEFASEHHHMPPLVSSSEPQEA